MTPQPAQGGHGRQQIAETQRPQRVDDVGRSSGPRRLRRRGDHHLADLAARPAGDSANTTVSATSSGRLSLASGRRLVLLGAAVEERRVHARRGSAASPRRRPASSAASARVKPTTPNFDAQYAVASPTRLDAQRRGDGDDAARRGAQARQGGAHHGGGAEQVDHDDLLPLVGGDVVQRAAGVDAGGGDDGVEAAGPLGSVADRRLGGVGVGEVDDARTASAPRRSAAPVEDDGRAAGARDGRDDGGAEPGGAAGDEDVPRWTSWMSPAVRRRFGRSTARRCDQAAGRAAGEVGHDDDLAAPARASSAVSGRSVGGVVAALDPDVGAQAVAAPRRACPRRTRRRRRRSRAPRAPDPVGRGDERPVRALEPRGRTRRS